MYVFRKKVVNEDGWILIVKYYLSNLSDGENNRVKFYIIYWLE